MPTYDYQCKRCTMVFEAEHAMNKRPRLKCPECGSRKTVKVMPCPTAI